MIHTLQHPPYDLLNQIATSQYICRSCNATVYKNIIVFNAVNYEFKNRGKHNNNHKIHVSMSLYLSFSSHVDSINRNKSSNFRFFNFVILNRFKPFD